MDNKGYIYGLLYKGKIVYIGLHNGKDKYYFSGGVIPRRMGKDKFIKGIIEYYDIDQLPEMERYYINKYKPIFNLTSGGETTYGTKHNKETIDKRKKSFLSNTEYINKLSIRTKERNIKNNPSIKFKVKCIEDGNIFSSIREAGRFYNICNGYLAKHIRGIYKSVKGLHFIRIDN